MDKKDRLKLLGENLKRSRERQNLTQEQIAEMAGISTSY